MTDARPGAEETTTEPQAPPPPPPPPGPSGSSAANGSRGAGKPGGSGSGAGAGSGDYETSSWPALLAVGAGVVALLAFGLWAWVVVIGGVLVMITLHEAGHFLTAKWAGMKCTEFFLGFGPKLWSFRRGETEYGLKAIPAGAYVRIIGMNNLDEVPPEDEARTYRQQSFHKRLIVVLGGPASHFVQAFVILFVMLAVVGVPRGSALSDEAPDPRDWFIGEITPDSAADEAGLRVGDVIVAWNGEATDTFADVQREIRATDVGDEVAITVERDGRTVERTAEIGERPDSGGGPFLGVGNDYPDYPNETVGVFEAAGRSVTETASLTKEAVAGLAGFFSFDGISNYADAVAEGSGSSSSSGGSGSGGGGGSSDAGDEDRVLSIVGAVRLGAQLGEEGAYGLLGFFLMINIFIAIVNLVPLLPFDGGHAVVAIYERVRSRRGRRYHADVTKLLPLAYVVVLGLVLLGVTSLYLDIVNPVEL
jgi:membrane-associated protease RseP (regulator of RpoE activity)